LHCQLQTSIKSLERHEKSLAKDIQKQNEALLENLSEQIKFIDKTLKECIGVDEELRHKAKLIQSMPGIGLQTTACLFIVSPSAVLWLTPPVCLL
jgi:hypothetical protein